MSSLSERSRKVTQRSGIGVDGDYVKEAKEKNGLVPLYSTFNKHQ